MYKLKIVLYAIAFIAFAAVSINYIVTQNNKLNLKSIEVKSLSNEIEELDSRYDNLNQDLNKANEEKTLNKQKVEELNQQKQDLEKEKLRLEAELQAKADSKLQDASLAVANRITNTSSASASSGDIISIITAAANKYGMDPSYAINIAKCESSLNPNSINYKYSENGKDFPAGLYQHLQNYWPARAAKYGYAGASVFDPVANANVTMGMWRDGSKNLWECN